MPQQVAEAIFLMSSVISLKPFHIAPDVTVLSTFQDITGFNDFMSIIYTHSVAQSISVLSI